MEMLFKVVGAKSFNDSVDGVKYNTTTLQVMMKEKQVSSEVRNVSGYNVVPMTFGLSDEFTKNKLGDLKYPIDAMLEVEPTTKGFICTGFKLNQPAKV